jgi:hypothetical protein
MQQGTVFHEGELQAQQRAGESNIAARNAANVKGHIIRGAFAFIRQQMTAYVASIDSTGRVWASVVLGDTGFLQPSDDGSALSIDLTKVGRQEHDPLWGNIRHDQRISLLLLDLQTRKRLKINGEAALNASRLTVHVTSSVPICPRYIQRRTIKLSAPGDQAMPSTVHVGRALGTEQVQLIRGADTLFLASAHRTQGADCSHRGGPPGFVETLPGGKLRVPDYNGNSMFNSFGNFLLDPRAGLVFPDYAGRRVLQLTGQVKIFWDQPDPRGVTGGTGRFWEFEVDGWIETQLPEALGTHYVDASPFLPKGR